MDQKVNDRENENNGPLTPEEQALLVSLMHRVRATMKENDGYMPYNIFLAWLGNFYANSAEVAIVRDQGDGPEIFLTERPPNDPFFKGKHVTGGIVVPGKNLKDTIERVWNVEFGSTEELPQVEFVDFFERMKGSELGEVVRGQETGFLFLVRVTEDFKSKKGEFYPLKSIPGDILPHHKIMIERLKSYLGVSES